MITKKKVNTNTYKLSKKDEYNRLKKVVSLSYCIELLKKDLLSGWVCYNSHQKSYRYVPDLLVKNPKQKSQLLFVLGFLYCY